MDEEGPQDTANKMIHIGHPINIDEEKFIEEFNERRDYVDRASLMISSGISKHIPTYTPKD